MLNKEYYTIDRQSERIMIDGVAYLPVRFAKDIEFYYKKGEVCALINFLGKVDFDEKTRFFPDVKDHSKVPILYGKGVCSVQIRNSQLFGDVKISLPEGGSVAIKDSELVGDVTVTTKMIGEFLINNSKIEGRNIVIKDSFVDNYDIQGSEDVMIYMQDLSSSSSPSTISAINLSMVNNNLHKFNTIKDVEINGRNITIGSNTNLTNCFLGDGVKIDNSQIHSNECISLTDATIVENSTINGAVEIVNTGIKNSEIEFGKFKDNAKIKDKCFSVIGSEIESCKGDMPKQVTNTILHDCDNINNYSVVNDCELCHCTFSKGIRAAGKKQVLGQSAIESSVYTDTIVGKYENEKLDVVCDRWSNDKQEIISKAQKTHDTTEGFNKQ